MFSNRYLKLLKLYKKSLENHLATLELRLSLTYLYKFLLKTLQIAVRQEKSKVSLDIDYVNKEIREPIAQIKYFKNSSFYNIPIG